MSIASLSDFVFPAPSGLTDRSRWNVPVLRRREAGSGLDRCLRYGRKRKARGERGGDGNKKGSCAHGAPPVGQSVDQSRFVTRGNVAKRTASSAGLKRALPLVESDSRLVPSPPPLSLSRSRAVLKHFFQSGHMLPLLVRKFTGHPDDAAVGR